MEFKLEFIIQLIFVVWLFQQLAILNHYKEKSIKLQIELAKLQRKYDVLNEKYAIDVT